MGQDYPGSVIVFGCQGDVVGQYPGRIEVDIRLDQGIIIIKRILLVAVYRKREIFLLAIRLLFRPLRTLRSKDGLGYFYERRR